jgi:hypothetical protein
MSWARNLARNLTGSNELKNGVEMARVRFFCYDLRDAKAIHSFQPSRVAGVLF